MKSKIDSNIICLQFENSTKEIGYIDIIRKKVPYKEVAFLPFFMEESLNANSKLFYVNIDFIIEKAKESNRFASEEVFRFSKNCIKEYLEKHFDSIAISNLRWRRDLHNYVAGMLPFINYESEYFN